MTKRIFRKIILLIILFLFFFSYVLNLSTRWAIKSFSFSNFDEILFTITSPVLNSSESLIYDYIKSCIIIPILAIIIIVIILIIRNKYDVLIKYKFYKRNNEINITNKKVSRICNVIFIGFVIVFSYKSIQEFGEETYFFEYIENITDTSLFIENNYIDPKSVEITFPSKKRNLIYIYLESMESTYSSNKYGGAYDINYIPELTKIANNNLNFSNSNLLGGAYSMVGSSWTIAAMVSHTSGLPLKSPFDGNLLGNYYNEIIPGAYTLGEILEENGYQNYLMVGSDASFGSRDLYFSKHGNYKIYDYYTAKEDEIIDDDYYVFWGMEDAYLFTYAKKELLKIAKENKPFNFTLLTVDTHTLDGYMNDTCEKLYDNLYLNAITCSDYKISEFLKWLKKQDFYNNTTIILTGDHLSMNPYSFDEVEKNGYNRTIYNAFINSAITTKNNKNREFLTYDMFPTTLASLNVSIKGDRLGLGTNLFSSKQTLLEKYNYEYVYSELSKTSIYYNTNILD